MSDRLKEINKKFRLLRPANEAEMRDEIATLRQQLETSEARVAMLEEYFKGANEVAAVFHGENSYWVNQTNQLLAKDSSAAWLLRKQAEAVEEIIDADPDGRTESGEALVKMSEIWDYSQRLRQQADDMERDNG